jgi:hypothetical protein
MDRVKGTNIGGALGALEGSNLFGVLLVHVDQALSRQIARRQ